MTGRFAARAAASAAVAAAHAAEVDRDARPPAEAIAALRENGLLAAAVPVALGGEGATLAELSEIATELGRACAETGMVFSMHQGQAMALWRHGGDSPAVAEAIAVVLAGGLMASSTTEKGGGGATGSSTCSVEPVDGGRVHLRKDSPVVSYATEAAAVLVTARRAPDAPASDQRLVVVPVADLTMTPTSEWDTLGFRGTNSRGYLLDAEVDAGLVLPEDYATISAHTIVPVSHVLWASTWLGIAASAADIARRAVRKQARTAIGTTPPAAVRLAELLVALQTMADSTRHAAARFDQIADDRDALGAVSYTLTANGLKIATSEAVVDIVTRALRIVGINAYRLDSDLSLGRHLRDAHGASMMISNERLLQTDAGFALLSGATL